MFSFLHLNVNSINGPEKRHGADVILSSDIFDMVIFQESKLGENTPDQSFDYPNYNMIRRDRVAGGGGLMVFIKKCYGVTFNYIDVDFETICLTLAFKTFPVNFIVTYNPHFQ